MNNEIGTVANPVNGQSAKGNKLHQIVKNLLVCRVNLVGIGVFRIFSQIPSDSVKRVICLSISAAKTSLLDAFATHEPNSCKITIGIFPPVVE